MESFTTPRPEPLRLRMRAAALRDALRAGDRSTARTIVRETREDHGIEAMLRLLDDAGWARA